MESETKQPTVGKQIQIPQSLHTSLNMIVAKKNEKRGQSDQRYNVQLLIIAMLEAQAEIELKKLGL